MRNVERETADASHPVQPHLGGLPAYEDALGAAGDDDEGGDAKDDEPKSDTDSDVLLELDGDVGAASSYGVALLEAAEGLCHNEGDAAVPVEASQTGLQDAPLENTSSAPPFPPPADVPEEVQGMHDPGVAADVAVNHSWGPFRFTIKRDIDKRGQQKTAWECHCPFHALNLKSGCKKTRIIKPTAEGQEAWQKASVATLQSLRNWAWRARAFDRQRHHMSAISATNLDESATFPVPDAPDGPPVSDDILDARVASRAKAEAKAKAKPRAKPGSDAAQPRAAEKASSSSSGSRGSSRSSSTSSSRSSSSS